MRNKLIAGFLFLSVTASAFSVKELAELDLSRFELAEASFQKHNAPLGLFAGWGSKGMVGYCNAFSRGDYFLTARHCAEKLKENRAEVFAVAFRNNRSDEINYFWVEEAGTTYRWGKKLYSPDLIRFSIPKERRDVWDAAQVRKEIESPLEVWSYVQSRDQVWKLEKQKCDVIEAPKMEVSFGRTTKEYGLAYSEYGHEEDAAFGLFLKGCLPKEGASGSPVLNQQGEVVAVQHTTLNAEIAKRTFEQEIFPRFLKLEANATLQTVKWQLTPHAIAVPLKFIVD